MFERDVALTNLPDDFKSQHPSIEWRLIKDFRNFIVHEYFGLDVRIVWDAVCQELPVLKVEVTKLKSL